jgi:predicted DNA-binding transcriptional regulator AlpA
MAKKNPPPVMRMKKLMEAAGVTKATVQFYVKEGLIPRPVKTYRNMAYYDVICPEGGEGCFAATPDEPTR